MGRRRQWVGGRVGIATMVAAMAVAMGLPADAQSPVPSEAASPAPEASASPGAVTGGTTYTVKAKDTMWAISQKFGVTIAALKAANPTVDPTKMRIGSVLVIPSK